MYFHYTENISVKVRDGESETIFVFIEVSGRTDSGVMAYSIL